MWIEDVVIPILVIIILGMLVLGVALYGVNELEKKSCKETANSMDINWKYSFWTPCLLKTSEGKYVPSRNYNSYIKG